MLESFPNKEVPKDRQLSGFSYVHAIFKEDGKHTKIMISTEVLCGHQNRVCANCVSMWMQDYDLVFERTAGGRALKERMQ
jgi:hypothetical protein